MYQYGLTIWVISAGLLFFHILLGYYGNRIFYLRYGRWTHETNQSISNKSLEKDAP